MSIRIKIKRMSKRTKAEKKNAHEDRITYHMQLLFLSFINVYVSYLVNVLWACLFINDRKHSLTENTPCPEKVASVFLPLTLPNADRFWVILPTDTAV